jgi:malate dehydrogenase (oxaloacetate-decarboxylating)(NADP+)
LAESLLPEEVKRTWLYPDIARIREVSVTVTRGVIRAAQRDGVDREVQLRAMSDAELEAWIRGMMYDPQGKVAKHVGGGGARRESVVGGANKEKRMSAML